MIGTQLPAIRRLFTQAGPSQKVEIVSSSPSDRYLFVAFLPDLALDFLAVAFVVDAFFFLPPEPLNAEAQLSEYFLDAPLRRSDMILVPW